jgi:hypothetical protein
MVPSHTTREWMIKTAMGDTNVIRDWATSLVKVRSLGAMFSHKETNPPYLESREDRTIRGSNDESSTKRMINWS